MLIMGEDVDQDGEMLDPLLKHKFSGLIKEASVAFGVDSNYATDIVIKAKRIIEKREARETQ